jgi:hypothetical protein
MVSLTWIVPTAISFVIYYTTTLDRVNVCIVTHASAKWPAIFIAVFFMISILVIYILYGKIIFVAFKKRRNLSNLKKKNERNEENIIAANQKKPNRNGARYIIWIISVFTICWLPSIVLVFYDVTNHLSGSFKKTKEMRCGYVKALIKPHHTSHEAVLGLPCIRDLMTQALEQCDVPGDEEDLCVAVLENFHDLWIVCLTRMCMLLALIGSLINPIIHSLCDPSIRKSTLYVKTR